MPKRGKSKATPKPRNPAVRALRASPLFKPRIVANPAAYKRKRRFTRNPVDDAESDDSN